MVFTGTMLAMFLETIFTVGPFQSFVCYTYMLTFITIYHYACNNVFLVWSTLAAPVFVCSKLVSNAYILQGNTNSYFAHESTLRI